MPTSPTPAGAAGTVAVGEHEVNRLGFGAMRITGRGIWGPPADHDEAVRVLRRAVELGVDFIDTADAYGPDVSEELIAEALAPYPEDLVIATKGGLVRPAPAGGTPTAGPSTCGRRSRAASAACGIDQVTLYQFHRPDPRGAVRGLGGRAGPHAGRGQDPPHRPVQRVDRPAGPGPGHRAHRLGAEPLQPDRPRLGGVVEAAAERDGFAFIPVGAGGRAPARRGRRAGGRGRAPRGVRRCRWRWPGSWPARRRCCPSPARRRWPTSRRTWPPPRWPRPRTTSPAWLGDLHPRG